MTNRTTIGHGALRYRVDTRWSKADPDRFPVRDCHEMVALPDGRLFLLTNHVQNNVLIYATDGALLDAWTLGLEEAHGLSAHNGSLFITDSDAGRVLKVSLDGRIELELPHPHACGAYDASEAYGPTETAIAANGDIYVADGYGSQYVLRFDRAGRYVGKFGGKGAQPIRPGRFMQVHGVAIDDRSDAPLLVCTERIRNELSWFTLEGEYVRRVYLPGAYLSRPVIAGRHLYAAVCFGMYPDDFRMWQNRGFVTILDDHDRVVSNPGGHAPVYRDNRLQLMLQNETLFRNCHDVCVDAAGDLYVCQWNSGGVYPYKLRRQR